MKKLKLRLSEEFTVHAVALLNHIHSQPRQPKPASLESRLEKMESASSPFTPPGDAREIAVKRATALK